MTTTKKPAAKKTVPAKKAAVKKIGVKKAAPIAKTPTPPPVIEFIPPVPKPTPTPSVGKLDLTGESVELGQSAEFFFVALTTLQQAGRTNLIPELLQLLTPRQLMQLVQVYGGKTLKLPTPRELSHALKLGLFIYKLDFLQQGEKSVIAELDLTPEELVKLQTGRQEWYAETKAAMGMGMYKSVLQQRDGASHG